MKQVTRHMPSVGDAFVFLVGARYLSGVPDPNDFRALRIQLSKDGALLRLIMKSR